MNFFEYNVKEASGTRIEKERLTMFCFSCGVSENKRCETYHFAPVVLLPEILTGLEAFQQW